MKGFKGLDADFKCKGLQFEVGKTQKVEGEIKLCKSGLHFTDSPLDTLSYYNPGDKSRYAEVEADGVSEEKESDTKRVASSLTIKAELKLSGVIKAGLEWVFSKVKASDKTQATSGNSAHSATSGDSAHSATSGNYAHSATSGEESIAASIGYDARAKAAKGSWIVVSEIEYKDGKYAVLGVKTAKIDGKKLKADTFYQLKGGNSVAVKA